MKKTDAVADFQKEGIRERIGKRFGVRPIFAGKERTTVEGKHRVTVYGCRRILIYSPKEIRLLLAKEELSVVGESLYCSSFSAGVVTVDGLIGGVLYRPWREKLFGGEAERK